MFAQIVIAMLTGGLQKAPAVDYTVPLGASPEFHRLSKDVKQRLSAKDFAGAQTISAMLPQSVATFRIDTSKVPADRKVAFVKSTKFAIDSWNAVLSQKAQLIEKKAGRADILFSFEPELAPDSVTKELPGAVLFYSTAPKDPRVEVVIGLKRTAQLLATTDVEVHNEVLNAVASYFGLGPTAMFGAATSRSNGQMLGLNAIKVTDAKTAEACLRLGKNLRLAAKNRVAVKPTSPKLFLSETVADFQPVLQGQAGERRILVANNGDAPLFLHAEGDCSCIRGAIVPTLNPGETTSLIARYDTDELGGDVVHHVLLTSNDPDQAVRKIPAKIHVDRRFDFIFPSGDTVLLEEPERKLEVFLHSNEKLPWNVLRAGVYPGDVPVRAEPFEGEVPDAMQGGKLRKVRGFRLVADLSKLNERQIFGRAMHSIAVQTTNPNQPVAKVMVFFQRGIIAQPESLYFGEPTGSIQTQFTLLRPGKPFKIQQILSDSPRLSARFTLGKSPDEYIVSVRYDGTAPEHKFDTQLRILTDDPAQPEIVVKASTGQ